MNRFVIVLPSVHDVMHAEEHLEGSGLDFEVIPKPTRISTDCGMVIETGSEALNQVTQLIDQNGLEVESLWRKTGPRQYEKLDEASIPN